eukprot:scaffold11235_cov98-Isochrysis_galbana.AAC.6
MADLVKQQNVTAHAMAEADRCGSAQPEVTPFVCSLHNCGFSSVAGSPVVGGPGRKAESAALLRSESSLL